MIIIQIIAGVLVTLSSFANLNSEPGQPVVKVGKVLIDTHDVHARLKRIPAAAHQTLTQADRYQLAVDQLVDEAILIHQARKNGIHRTQAYATALHETKQALLIELMIKQLLTTDPGISDATANQFYQNNAPVFDAIHQRRFQYSLSTTQSEAANHYAQLIKNPHSIPLISGGWITESHAVPALASAVFSLPSIGDIAPPVRTDNGYYVIRLMGINQTPKQSKADSLALIKSELKFEQRQALIDAYIKQSSTTIHVHRY
ncbi:peptidylprolyl isomerase [Candidatus Marinamargulisbacteria bacterium]|nr:peptidylprolyl isomerase [Candidatus Marinamargulisbacteria bacterium]MDG2264608.1 peptidylprolyl isomerase [Candidatus Marinamargulisbacteria bacterium]